MKFIIDIDLHPPKDDCSYCPMFHREGNESAVCAGIGDRDAFMDSVPKDTGRTTLQTFPIPKWCPLVPAETYYTISCQVSEDGLWYEYDERFRTLDDARDWVSGFSPSAERFFKIVEHSAVGERIAVFGELMTKES